MTDEVCDMLFRLMKCSDINHRIDALEAVRNITDSSDPVGVEALGAERLRDALLNITARSLASLFIALKHSTPTSRTHKYVCVAAVLRNITRESNNKIVDTFCTQRVGVMIAQLLNWCSNTLSQDTLTLRQIIRYCLETISNLASCPMFGAVCCEGDWAPFVFDEGAILPAICGIPFGLLSGCIQVAATAIDAAVSVPRQRSLMVLDTLTWMARNATTGGEIVAVATALGSMMLSEQNDSKQKIPANARGVVRDALVHLARGASTARCGIGAVAIALANVRGSMPKVLATPEVRDVLVLLARDAPAAEFLDVVGALCNIIGSASTSGAVFATPEVHDVLARIATECTQGGNKISARLRCPLAATLRCITDCESAGHTSIFTTAAVWGTLVRLASDRNAVSDVAATFCNITRRGSGGKFTMPRCVTRWS